MDQCGEWGVSCVYRCSSSCLPEPAHRRWSIKCSNVFPRFTLSLICHIEDIPIEICLERGISLLHAVFIYLKQREQSFLGMLERCKQDYAFVIMLLSHNLLYTCFSCDMSGGFSDQIIYSEVSFERH